METQRRQWLGHGQLLSRRVDLASTLARRTATLHGDLALPISTIYIKTHDAADWMSIYDGHPAAVSGPAAIQNLIDIYGAQGIEVAAWFVPKGTDYDAQLQLALQVIDSGVTALYADLEPFPGFCFLQCKELAENLWNPLRELRPDAHLGVIYDPRPWWWEQSATAEWFSVADSALPMCYWESYTGQATWGGAASCVVQAYADLSVLAPGRDLAYLPMLQGNSTANRFEEALDAAAGVGSERVSVWRRGVVDTEVWELIDDYSEPSYIHCRSTLADGCLFEAMATGSIWLMQAGGRFLIADLGVVAGLGLTEDDLQLVDDGFLPAVPTVPQDGALITDEGTADVYVVYDGTRFRMGEGDYAALGLDPESVVTIHCHLIRAGRREWDEGNIGSGGSLKWVVDALVKLGAIKEDSPRWVRYTTPTQEYQKPKSIYFKGALIVTLEWNK
ncbi:MAG: hypothetical protein IH921_05785 [Gemmatimonadetes bacterium]|nr:hypothetical protein [Gemmatimonadota bacterium]